MNATITELLRLLGTEHVRTIAHSHEENSIVERVNKEVMRHLRALVFDDKTFANWSLKLPLVQRILNSSVHDSIGVSPAQLLLGNAISLDKEVFLPITALNVTERQLSEWADQRLRQQRDIIKAAQAKQRALDEKHILERASSESKKRKLTEDDLEIGSYVLAAYPDTGMGHRPPNKLMMPNRGPYQIVAKQRGACLCRDLATNKDLLIKVHLLKPYYHDPETQDPRETALGDKQMFVIQKVLRHRGDPKRKTTLEFLIQWEGFDESANTWEPWKNVRETQQIHAYLKQHKTLAKLIPKLFK